MADPKTVYLKDYQAPSYHVDSFMLRFYLDPEKTRVHSTIKMYQQNPCSEIYLNGQDMDLIDVILDGKSLSSSDYTLSEEGLTIHQAPKETTLEVITEFSPKENKALEGLYESSGILCTQNEPEGFRRMTYFFDRPDVMTKYTSYLEADKEKYPYLLSNGNLIDQGDLENGKHFCTWEDPFPKPTYLFALVAGDLGRIQDHFTTMSGRKVLLEIYCDPGMESQCFHAMEALKKSMTWDEEKFAREYDLDRYMIVAVDSFNMGAMENKGLNIFNSSCVLADPDTATDANFKRVEEVIAHEYFHNWTGNRITCRDWFQLTLKEGLTVFRDQEFTADMHDRAVERIDQAKCIKGRQFAEDAGPMSHPIKPASYIEINNFYSSTVYRKGAEVIRMIHTLIGEEGFRKGMDHYFANYDGQAVTTEEFLSSMEKGGNIDLSLFSRWYHQAGTPDLFCEFNYNKEEEKGELTLTQKLPKTLYGGTQDPMHMPLKLSLYGKGGDVLASDQIDLKDETQTFIFSDIKEKPLLSINENFTSPVHVKMGRSFEEALDLFVCEKDPYNKWTSLQEIYKLLFNEALDNKSKPQIPEPLIKGLTQALHSKELTQAYLAELLAFPVMGAFIDMQDIIDMDQTIEIYHAFEKELGEKLWDTCLEIYQSNCTDKPYIFSSEEMGRRALKNKCLGHLSKSGRPESEALCQKQLDQADNMTDGIVPLSLLTDLEGEHAISLLDTFYKKWNSQSLVVNKWLLLHACSKRGDTFKRVQEISQSPAFDYTIPNRIRALHGAFIGNIPKFHNKDGSGYQWILQEARYLDAINPQIASGLLGGFEKIKRMDDIRKAHMVSGLKEFLDNKELSKDSYEIASKTLNLVSH